MDQHARIESDGKSSLVLLLQPKQQNFLCNMLKESSLGKDTSSTCLCQQEFGTHKLTWMI